MDGNETFTQFHTKLNEIVNALWALGETIMEGKFYN